MMEFLLVQWSYIVSVCCAQKMKMVSLELGEIENKSSSGPTSCCVCLHYISKIFGLPNSEKKKMIRCIITAISSNVCCNIQFLPCRFESSNGRRMCVHALVRVRVCGRVWMEWVWSVYYVGLFTHTSVHTHTHTSVHTHTHTHTSVHTHILVYTHTHTQPVYTHTY